MRLLGHIPDAAVERPTLSGLLGAAPPPPARVDLSAHVLSVPDQALQDCVANATAQALRMALHAQGTPAPALPSRRLIYWAARRAANDQLQDKGCRPWDAFEAIRTEGYCLESVCPYAPAAVFEPPPPFTYEHMFDQIGGLAAYRGPDGGGDAAVAAMQAGLAAGHPMTLALQVSQDFLDGTFTGPWTKPTGPAGHVIGGHYVCAVGYDATGVRVVNSWGPGWQDGGFARLSWATIADASVCSDLYAIVSVKNESDAP